MNWNHSTSQNDTKPHRSGRFNDQLKGLNTLTEAEIRTYYKTVLGEQRVPDSQTILLLQCIFKPHTDGMRIDLRSGRWSCSAGCGEGDVFAFEMLLRRADHFRRCKQSVLEIIASASSGSNSSRLVEADVQKLVARIGKRPGSTRRYLQQLSHWPAWRFRRAINHAEVQALVSWQDRDSTAGQTQRSYYPAAGSSSAL
jgi:hypothetical protein